MNNPSVAPAYSFLRACRGEPVEETPIWIMRQAGRYLPEYRAIRETHSFLDVCRVPEVCAEVTAQPIERFGFDAAILFQDILIPLLGMGVPVEFDPSPKLGFQVRTRDDLDRVRWEGIEVAAPHIRPVIRAVRERLQGRVPLIGFAGSPFTMAAYLVDAGSRDLARTRSFLARDPEGFARLLEILGDATIDYLKAQIGAGVDAVMLFDTQAGWLPPSEFALTAVGSADRVIRALPKGTPTIYFALAPSVGHLEALRGSRADVLGLDYRASLSQARAILGNARAVQGNLDPAALLGPGEEIVVRADAILRENAGRPGHIFNLGHGIFPDTPVESVKLLVDTVKRHRAAGRAAVTRTLAQVTADVLAKYDRPGPRYTSYPTAIEFHESFTPQRYLEKLDEASHKPDEPLSLYVHLPFCRARCSFCGCNVIITRKEGVADAYLDQLVREIALVSERLGKRTKVVQYHWGGGTPTYLDLAQMRRVWDAIASRFSFEPGAEIAIEVDPRVTSREQSDLLKELGFNRISMGVQDFDAEVQDAVNRYQTFEQTRDLHFYLRGLGIESINFDFIYGLPHQTPKSFRNTIELALELRPDRVACYSYAFVPWIKAHQKAIRIEDLPPREMKLELFGIAHELFTRAGYQQIGMDHFALETDSLAIAARDHTLFRNFMGYTTHPAKDSVGFGVSAIGDLGGAFAQNTKKLNRYQDALDAGLPPIERGFERSQDDEIRRDVIQSLMCNFHLDIRGIERAYGIEFASYFADSLRRLDEGPGAHGFVTRTPDAIEVTGNGRLFVRNVCMEFDAYLPKREGEKPVFSRTV